MTGYFEAQDGRRLAFEDSGGDGPAVLCLAGLTRDARDFAPLAAHLADRYRVLRIDSRGRGLSDRAGDPLTEYTVPVEARDALGLLDHLAIPRAAVIGTSRGGVLGMILGATKRDRLSCLVLNDVGPVIERRGLDDIMVYLGVEPAVDSFEALAAGLQQVLGPAFPDVGPERWLAFARATHRDENGRPRLSYDPRLRDAVAMQLESSPPDLWDLFAALEGLPILTLRGANSVLFSAATLTEMARRRPDMAQAVVPNRGHPPFLDEPVALAAIDAFLADHAR